MSPFSYPPATKISQTDDYHGTLVADPYRWLEDPDSPETKAWVEAQNDLTFGFLEQIPARQRLKQRLTELWSYRRAQAPAKRHAKENARYFQLRNTGLQNQDVLYVAEKPQEAGRLLLDPNALSEDGTVALSGWRASEDGHWLAYATSASGSDWLTWRVRNVDDGTDLPDLIEWSKFSTASWRKDGSGFYYSRYDLPAEGATYTGANYFQKVYFHRLGEHQAQDSLVYERPDQKEWGFNAEVSDDDRYLIFSVWQGTDVRNRLFYQDLAGEGPVVELIAGLEATYEWVGNDGPLFYLRTTLDAPRSRLIAIDITQPQKNNWCEIIPQSDDSLEAVTMIHGEFIVLYLHDAYHQLKRFDRQGQLLGEIALPSLGSLPFFVSGQRDDEEMFYVFSSFLYPSTVCRYDFNTGQSQAIFTPDIPFDTGPYLTRQVFATSKDGTRIPIFLTHRRDLRLDGQNPTLLYGYGGFNVSLTPSFAPGRLAWLELGGVYAVAILRGGGEYGEDWHQAGMLHKKQNVFDDFIACGEYLIAERITSTPKLAIQGGSNGGLLVGACLAQRPDLFGAALPAVGVMDMLRFHKFTIGWAWVSDYGSSEDPAQFRTLYAYSPLHNLKPGTHYPPTLVTTADHDDRVVPGHSFKFAAALQAAQAGDAPALIRIQTKAGHGAGKPTAIIIQESADLWAFLVKVLNMEN